MGVDNLLPKVLPSVAQEVDLQTLAEGHYKSTGQPLRVAIDLLGWVHRASHGMGSSLEDDRPLTNAGRYELYHEKATDDALGGVDESSNSDALKEEYIDSVVNYCIERLLILEKMSKVESDETMEVVVVLDGATPPAKQAETRKRMEERRQHAQHRDAPLPQSMTHSDNMEEELLSRSKSTRRAGAGKLYPHIRRALVRRLAAEEISFLIAPYEADSQLAYMAHAKYTDLIISEDSDMIAYGYCPVLYKLNLEVLAKSHRGTGKLVRPNAWGACSELDWMDFSPSMMTCLFVLAGCDYAPKMKGIGAKTACKHVREAFFNRDTSQFPSALDHLFNKLQLTTRQTKQEWEKYREQFLGALLCYRHPIVFDPVEEAQVVMGWPYHKVRLARLDPKCRDLRGKDLARSLQSKFKGKVPLYRRVEGDDDLTDYKPYSALVKNWKAHSEIVGRLLGTGNISSSRTLVAADLALGKQYLSENTKYVEQLSDLARGKSNDQHDPTNNPKHTARPMATTEDEILSSGTEEENEATDMALFGDTMIQKRHRLDQESLDARQPLSQSSNSPSSLFGRRRRRKSPTKPSPSRSIVVDSGGDLEFHPEASSTTKHKRVRVSKTVPVGLTARNKMIAFWGDDSSNDFEFAVDDFIAKRSVDNLTSDEDDSTSHHAHI